MPAAVLLKLPPELVDQIDAARGDVPRTVWIRRACEAVLRGDEEERQRALHPPMTVRRALTLLKPKPAPAPFRSRLKGEWKAP